LSNVDGKDTADRVRCNLIEHSLPSGTTIDRLTGFMDAMERAEAIKASIISAPAPIKRSPKPARAPMQECR